MTTEVFTHDDLYDPDVIQEARQLDAALVDIIDATPRFEPAILIALTLRFEEICEQADIDPEAAFAQIMDGVLGERFDAPIQGFVHEGTNTTH